MINLGSSPIASLKLGSTDVTKVMLGTAEVWSANFSDSFDRPDGPIAPPWSSINYGVYPNTVEILSNRLRITGRGYFYNTADNSIWVYKNAPNGNFKIGVRVISTSGDYCRCLMMRKSLNANSAMICSVQNASTDQISLLWRDSDGAGASWTGGVPNAPFLGLIHSLDFINGTVRLLNSSGGVITSRSISWIPSYVGLAFERASNDGTVVYDDYTETSI